MAPCSVKFLSIFTPHRKHTALHQNENQSLTFGGKFAISIRLARNAFKAFGNNADYRNDSAGGTCASND
jgi:hypothetical protein